MKKGTGSFSEDRKQASPQTKITGGIESPPLLDRKGRHDQAHGKKGPSWRTRCGGCDGKRLRLGGVGVGGLFGGAGRDRTAASQFCRTSQADDDQAVQSMIEGDATRKNPGS